MKSAKKERIIQKLYAILNDSNASEVDKQNALTKLQELDALQLQTATNWIPYKEKPTPAPQEATRGFGILNRFGPGKSLFNTKLNMDALKNIGPNFRATRLFEGGPTMAQTANTISGLYQGGKAIKGVYENINSEEDLNNLQQDIRLQMASNPMYDMYLDAGDERLLRQMKNGNLTNNVGNMFEGAAKGLPKAGLAAILGGVTGGAPGAFIGGIGSLINSGIEGYGKGTQETSSQLQGLYDRLRQADQEYRTMKRPTGLRRAGLSTNYYNQLY